MFVGAVELRHARYPAHPLARRSVLIVALMLAAAPAASAADPIVPLAEVRPGMSCTGLSVIRGTAISSFDVEIIDVIAAESGLSGPRMLVRVSGPAVDATGVGPGFSGSPILCDGRNAGAISEAIGEYGNHVVLATPIEEMLREQPRAPLAARRDPALLRAARPLAAPLTVSGLSGRGLRLFERAAQRAGTSVLAAPAGPLGGFAPAPLVPGAAVAASISTGDLALGAVGTVTYRDGDRVWAFGHALDGLGRRSLFLTDAYVFGVIQNPLGIPDWRDHLQARLVRRTRPGPGHERRVRVDRRQRRRAARVDPAAGDGAGRQRPAGDARLGAGRRARAAPRRRHGLRGAARRLPGGRHGCSARVGPARLSVCARFHVQERRRPIGFCNPYFGIDAALLDLTDGAQLVDSYDLGPLHIERTAVHVRARPGVRAT